MRVGKAGLNTRGRKKTKSAACLCELAADRSGNRCRGEVRLDIEVLHFHTVYRGLCSANGVDQINIIDGELLELTSRFHGKTQRAIFGFL